MVLDETLEMDERHRCRTARRLDDRFARRCSRRLRARPSTRLAVSAYVAGRSCLQEHPPSANPRRWRCPHEQRFDIAQRGLLVSHQSSRAARIIALGGGCRVNESNRHCPRDSGTRRARMVRFEGQVPAICPIWAVASICYPGDQLTLQLLDWFVRQPRRNGTVRARRLAWLLPCRADSHARRGDRRR